MESRTKNRQSEAVLRKMAEKFFGTDGIAGWKELTEGYFNAAYEVRLESGLETILKVAPPAEVPVMSYEKNIMASEVEAMRLASQNPEIPIARIYGYDDSRSICPSPYFFMEKLPGASLSSLAAGMTEEEIHDVYFQAGKMNRKINEICCPRFGLPGQPEYQGEEWYPVFEKMLALGVEDAKARRIDLKISVDQMWRLLERDREFFREIREPRLVHWDCWDGNIFVKDGKITGFIDWERCLWADPLMEVGFRTYRNDVYFRKGYGWETLSASQARRALWYDVYVMVLVALEYEYRKYETAEMYDWSTGILRQQLNLLLEIP